MGNSGKIPERDESVIVVYTCSLLYICEYIYVYVHACTCHDRKK